MLRRAEALRLHVLLPGHLPLVFTPGFSTANLCLPGCSGQKALRKALKQIHSPEHRDNDHRSMCENAPTPTAEVPIRSKCGVSGLISPLVIFLAVMIPLLVLRSSYETSISIDDLYSLYLAQHPVRTMVQMSARDAHPPLYYLVLWQWLELPPLFGVEGGILWARLLNICLWGVSSIGIWFSGKRLLGNAYGAIVLWVTAASVPIVFTTRLVRNYTMASFALFLCFLLLLRLWQVARRDPGSRWNAAAGWAAYAVLGAVALWSHLFASIVLLCLGCAWVILAYSLRGRPSRFAIWGAAAHGAILLLFLPWTVHLFGQIAYIQNSHAPSIRAPLGGRIAEIFFLFFPLGEASVPGASFPAWKFLLGALCVALPLAVALIALGKPRSNDHPEVAGLMAVLGFLIGMAYVGILWAMQFLRVIKGIDVPRYTIFGAPFWAAGIAGLSIWAGARLKWKPIAVWLLAAPWLICSLVGSIHALQCESRGGLDAWKAQHLSLFPAPGEPLYAFPRELLPFFKKTLAAYEVRAAEDLPIHPPDIPETSVLNLAPWWGCGSPPVSWVHSLLETDGIAAQVLDSGDKTIPGIAATSYRVYRLRGIQLEMISEMADRPIPQTAVAIALAENQKIADHWHSLEGNLWAGSYRWGAGRRSLVRFDRPIQPGDYTLHYVGCRAAFPADPSKMTFRFEGEKEKHTVRQQAGNFHVQLPVRITKSGAPPVLRVEHATWSPLKRGLSADSRILSAIFSYAYLMPNVPASRDRR